LQSRIDELVEANDDIKNLLDATQIATIFLDIDFNIRRFTPKVTDFLHLTASDIGRPIEHFATTLKDVQLQDYGRKVLTDLTVQEHEVENSQGRFYRMRVRPYRTLSNVIDGVVITFEDISEHKRVLKEGIEKEKQWRGLVENAPMGIFIQTDERFSYINPFASKLFGAPFSEAMIGTSVLDRIQPDFHDMIKKRIRTVISKKKAVPARDEKWLRLDGTAIDLVVSAAPTVYKGKNAALVFIREKI
jgi:two-component system CheB/CheR fusion protein